MRTFTAVIEKCPVTGLYVGHVPGFHGAHSQAQTLDELKGNLQEVLQMLLEDGKPKLEAEFVGPRQLWSPDEQPLSIETQTSCSDIGEVGI